MGIIHIFADGRVRSGYLAAAADVQIGRSTVRLAAGDNVIFREDGRVERCTPNAGITVSTGGRQVGFKGGELIVNPDGSVVSGTLLQDTKLAVGGVEATFVGGTQISYYPSGAVRDGQIRPLIVEVGGQEVSLSGNANFFENGVPLSGVPQGEVKVGGNAFTFSWVKFDSSRRVILGELSGLHTLRLGGRSFVFYTSISFSEDGSVASGNLFPGRSEPVTFTMDGKPFTTRLSYVKFDPDGAIKYAETAEDNEFTFQGEKIPKWSLIYVYRSKKGDESAFYFPKDSSYRLQLEQDVPVMIAGEELMVPKGSRVEAGFLTNDEDAYLLIPSKALVFMGQTIGRADADVSRGDLEK
jgi:hypothetical protein